MKQHVTASFFVFLLMLTVVLPLNTSAQFFGGFGGSSQTQGVGTTSQRTYLPEGMIGEAIIEADHDSRSIIIIADEETNAHIQQIITNLDRPVQQVLIKVVFVEVTYRDDVDYGVEGTLTFDHDRHRFQTLFGLAAETRGGFYQILESDLEVTMRAISEKGRLEVLSRPSILTRNNQEAIITVGSEVPFVTDTRITESGQQINTIVYEDIGIILRVTPFITRDGLVEMILAPEISTLTDETVPISDTLRSPVFAKRSADTVVVTPNGQTVVIGGLMEDNKTEVTSKIPLLGDIPLLGLAFRRTRKENTKTELLIFLTPYVVEGPQRLVEMSEEEKSRSELIQSAFDQVKINKYVNPSITTPQGGHLPMMEMEGLVQPDPVEQEEGNTSSPAQSLNEQIKEDTPAPAPAESSRSRNSKFRPR
jgi:general secretion pathway protein D